MDNLRLKDTDLADQIVRKLQRHGVLDIVQLAEQDEIRLKLYSLRYDEIQEVKDLLARYGRYLVGDEPAAGRN